MSCTFPLRGFLSVGEDPDVGGDAGVVEELLGQGDDGLQPVVLDDPAGGFALAAAGVAGEERRTVEDDGEAAAAVLGARILETCAGGRGARRRSRAACPRRSGRRSRASRAPSRCSAAAASTPRRRADWRACSRRSISCHRHAVEAVLGESVAEDDVIGILAFDEHVGFADGPGFVVPVLTEELRLRVGIEVVDVFLRDGQHAARAAGGIVDGFDDVTASEVFLRREQEIDHELDHLARREVFSSFLVRLLRADPDEFLEDVAHLDVVHALRREVDLAQTP